MNEMNENLPSVDDLLAGGGSKSLSFKDFAVGDSYEGTIAGLRTVQVRKITLTGTKPAKNPRYNDVKLYGIELSPATSNPAVDALLSSGATEVKGAKMSKLTEKQISIANTLQSNGFDAAEIAENLGVSVEAVNASLTF
jgi:DNA-binding NarL/FixJ family response regulator